MGRQQPVPGHGDRQGRLVTAWMLAALALGGVALVNRARTEPVESDAGYVRTQTLPTVTFAPDPEAEEGDGGIPATEVSTPVSDGSSPNASPPVASPPEFTTTTVAAPPPVTRPPEPPDVVSRPIPNATPSPAPQVAAPAWAATTRTTDAGYSATDVGCAAGTDAASLDTFFQSRLGPMIGEDYQHVYPLGDGRYLWIFQDTFIDHPGGATRLDQASFVHNSALVQDGACFTLYHRGSTTRPLSFESGTGEQRLSRWFWPMGGEVTDGRLSIFWAEMKKDDYEPGPGDGLGWHPEQVWLATYDASTLARIDFQLAANPTPTPIYGYAVASDAEYTYLFGNSFEQNLVREGGFNSSQHSATSVYLARVPLGQLGAAPEYRTTDGWSGSAADAVAIVNRFHVENPMQPRYLDGVWYSVAKVDGYWGEDLMVERADQPWGPWTTIEERGILPRDGDPLMNTYHAHLMPWMSNGELVVSISQNARDMAKDAYPHPVRYRPAFFTESTTPPPPPPETTTTVPETSSTSTTVPETTTSTTSTTSTTTTTTTTTQPPDTTTTPSTTQPPDTTTSTPSSTTEPPDETTSTTSTTEPSTGEGDQSGTNDVDDARGSPTSSTQP